MRLLGIMKITQAPVIASHSNSRAVCPHARNLTDDMFRAIRDTGGVAGINQFAEFLGEKPTLEHDLRPYFSFSGNGSGVPVILRWAATWTAVMLWPRALRVSRAIRLWPSACWSGA